MAESWAFYKARHMENNQRVRSQTFNGTISEGQSYALAKALTHNDPQVFDAVYRWTIREMKRPNDTLLGWRWGQLENGKTGLIYDDSAPDADEDIAYYLILAGERWHKPDYIAHAKAMINDFWRLNVQKIGARYYVSSGTWSGFHDGVFTLNPSYFAPYVYRKFAEVDPSHPWQALAEDIYPTLEACSALTQTGLPPNWCGVTYDTHQIVFSDVQGANARDFSWDAVRVFWRMRVDAAMGSKPAHEYLANHLWLGHWWNQHHSMPSGFSPMGVPYPDDSMSLRTALLAQMAEVEPTQKEQAYKDLLGASYSPEGWWQDPQNDFLQSLVWFALYGASLPVSVQENTSQ